jgi:hypothetical protein
VNFIGWKRPGYAVLDVNPNLVRQKSKRLMSSIVVLGANLDLPSIGQGRNRKKESDQQGTSAEG